MILNLTQHPATPEQKQAGVVDLDEPLASELRYMLTFYRIPSKHEVVARANGIAEMAYAYEPRPKYAMIGGAPFLMAPLEKALLARGISPVYAFSRRETREHRLEDGTVEKVTIFRHIGFVEV